MSRTPEARPREGPAAGAGRHRTRRAGTAAPSRGSGRDGRDAVGVGRRIRAAVLDLAAGLLPAALLVGSLPSALRAAEEGAGIFSLDLGLVIWTWVLFLLTLGVLAWKVFPWIAGGLEERQARIQEAIDRAREDRREARRLLEEQKNALEEARRRAQEQLEEGRRAGQKLREEILAQAREEQERLLESARRELARERERMSAEVRREAVEVSIAAAERLLRSSLDSERNRELVSRFVEEMA